MEIILDQDQFFQGTLNMSIKMQNGYPQNENNEYINMMMNSNEQLTAEQDDSKNSSNSSRQIDEQKFQQDYLSQNQMIIESTSDILKSENKQSRVEEEQLQVIKNRYQKQLQIKIKRVKQTIKKGQHIRQKKLFFQPINNLFLYNIKLDSKFLIYGFMFIEDNYPDYQSQYDSNLINQFDQYLSIQAIQKDNQNQLFQFVVTPTVDNLMKKFNNICQYYENYCNAQQKQLAIHLKKYEEFIQELDYQFKIISEKYTKEELENYYEIYFEECHKYIKQCSVDEFMTYNLFKYNLKVKQLEPISNGTSFALLNLMGVQIENIELFLKKCNSFMDPSGMSRLENVLNVFEFINCGKDEITQKIPIRTIDQLVINSDACMQYFKTDKIPEDLNKIFKYQCVVQKFSIDIREIEKVIKLRGGVLVDIYNHLFEESVYIEKTIMNEVFLEKYYPETFYRLKGQDFNINCQK
ncbi:hypothetical protein ABPG74_013950 [Tetrahymena malaccensis]